MPEQDQQAERALERSESLGHEVRDISFTGAALAGVGVLALVAVGMLLMYWYAVVVAGGIYDEPTPPRPAPTPIHQEPFQANQHLLRKRQEAVRRRVLESYTWVEEGRVARIPVERAIEVLAERGDLSLFGQEEQADREQEEKTRSVEEVNDDL